MRKQRANGRKREGSCVDNGHDLYYNHNMNKSGDGSTIECMPGVEPQRIAQIIGFMNSGGVEAVVMNYYRAIDKTKVQFDFFVNSGSMFPQREEIERLGGRYYIVPTYRRVFPYIRAVRTLLKQNGYRVVHAHINTLNVIPLFAAWLAGVPVRICHNHSTANWGEGIKTYLKYLLRVFAKAFATDYFACGEKAGCWMYGNRCFDTGKVHIMPNAIDTRKFFFDADARAALRKELEIGEHTFVMGHVGRFAFQKNHDYLIDIFSALHRSKADSVLVLIGEGDLEKAVEAKVEALGLSDCVRFLGVRKNVDKLYSVMDVFCLPSYYEGLPVVLVEALANGLPCVVSDCVTMEIAAESIQRLNLSQDAQTWADAALQTTRTAQADNLVLERYDISRCARKMQEYYIMR